MYIITLTNSGWLGRRPLSHYKTYNFLTFRILAFTPDGLSIASKPRKKDHLVRLREKPLKGEKPAVRRRIHTNLTDSGDLFIFMRGRSVFSISIRLFSSASGMKRKQRHRRSSGTSPLRFFTKTPSPLPRN